VDAKKGGCKYDRLRFELWRCMIGGAAGHVTQGPVRLKHRNLKSCELKNTKFEKPRISDFLQEPKLKKIRLNFMQEKHKNCRHKDMKT
jgi:hypothetical protein